MATLMLVSVAAPASVSALTSDQQQSIASGVLYFNRDDELNDTCATTGTATTTTTTAGDTMDKFLQAIALHESNGNPTAGSPGGASGKYQITPVRWGTITKSIYPPANQYAYAGAAPENVQDAAAYLDNLGAYGTFKGDPFWMAVAWYQPSAASAYPNKNATSLNVVPSGGNTLTYAQYGNIIAQAVSTGILPAIPGKSDTTGPINKISLSYTTAPDFQTWLAKDGGAPSASTTTTSASSIDSSTATCTGSGGSSGVAAGNFVFYSQADKRWAALPYGPDGTIQTSGCGPTSVAMVVATLADSSITPADTAAWGNAHGSDTGGGSIWQIMLVEGPENWGLHVTQLGTNLNQAINVLNSGGLVIAAGTGSAPFTTDGHILVLRGIASNGDFLVGDPNSPPPPSPNVGDPQDQYSAATLLSSGLKGLFGVTK